MVSVCCSALHLINVTHAHIDGIQVAANSSHLSGLIIEQCTDILISNAVLTLISTEMHTSEFGVLVFGSSEIVVDSLQASNFSWGMAACKSMAISISNTKIQNSIRSGVLI